MNPLFLSLAVVLFFLTPTLGDPHRWIPFRKTGPDGAVTVGRLTRGGPGFVYSRTLPKHVAGAIVTSEDGDFFHHRGVDWVAIAEAWRDYQSGKDARPRGASTLTQQLVKNAYLTPRRTYVRKVREIALALRLESVLSKEEILDYYLNSVEFGAGVYGVQAASRLYFGALPEDLTPEQAASLAYLLPSPKKRGESLARGAWDAGRNWHVAWCVASLRANGWLQGTQWDSGPVGSGSNAPPSVRDGGETNEGSALNPVPRDGKTEP